MNEGKFVMGMLAITAAALAAVAALVGVFTLLSLYLGSVVTVIVSALVVFGVATVISGRLTSKTGARWYNMGAAMLSSYAGWCFFHAHRGFFGAIEGALLSSVLTAVLITVIMFVGGKKFEKKEEQKTPAPPHA